MFTAQKTVVFPFLLTGLYVEYNINIYSGISNNLEYFLK